MQDDHRTEWDERHANAEGVGNPSEVLLRNRHLLPKSGKALDFACGRGANALELAKCGLDTHAWDFSAVAIERLHDEAQQRGLSVEGEERDVVSKPPEPNSFDLIIVTHFLERDLFPALMAALRPGGLLFYQTFIREIRLDRGPKSTEWRLGNNELLQAFSDLRVHYYLEEGALGAETSEVADLAMLVASKPA